jgi:hypothetical protein
MLLTPPPMPNTKTKTQVAIKNKSNTICLLGLNTVTILQRMICNSGFGQVTKTCQVGYCLRHENVPGMSLPMLRKRGQSYERVTDLLITGA